MFTSYSIVVVDNAREVNFLEEFFSPENQYGIETLCMNNNTDRETLAKYATEIVAEWQLRGEKHTDYKEAAKHLINHLRKKFEADRRAAKENADRPKSRQETREALLKAARDGLASAIENDRLGLVDCTANDTKPF